MHVGAASSRPAEWVDVAMRMTCRWSSGLGRGLSHLIATPPLHCIYRCRLASTPAANSTSLRPRGHRACPKPPACRQHGSPCQQRCHGDLPSGLSALHRPLQGCRAALDFIIFHGAPQPPLSLREGGIRWSYPPPTPAAADNGLQTDTGCEVRLPPPHPLYAPPLLSRLPVIISHRSSLISYRSEFILNLSLASGVCGPWAGRSHAQLSLYSGPRSVPLCSR